MEMPLITQNGMLTASTGDPEPLRNGIDRPVDGDDNAWWWKPGDWVSYTWENSVEVDEIRLICDSDLNAIIRMNIWEPPIKGLPTSLVRDLRIEILQEGNWIEWKSINNNEQRILRISVNQKVAGVRVHLVNSWGKPECRLFAFTVNGKG